MNKYFLLLWGLWSCWGLAQKEQERLSFDAAPLAEILTEVEGHFGVTFAYNTKLVTNKTATITLSTTDLNNVLATLGQRFKLQFKEIDATTYVVQAIDKNTYCGYLLDAVLDTPIVGASIRLRGSDKGTITAANGYFELGETEDWTTLSITYLGYETRVITKGEMEESGCPKLYLFQKNVQLKEVIVSEYLVPGVQKQRDGSIRINPTNLDILSGLGEPDVLQSTQLLPGIVSPTETASGIFIRGGTPDQNLILWDGIKLYNADHFFGVFSAFNPYVVASIEVYRSGANANYGDRVSGVLDIKTASKVPERLKGGFGFNLTTADAYLDIPLGKQTGLQISGRRSLTDVYNSPNFQNYSTRVFQNTSVVREEDLLDSPSAQIEENIVFYDTHLKFNSRLSNKDRLAISGLLTNNRLDYTLDDPNFPEFSVDNLNVVNEGLSAVWERQWNTKLSSTFTSYYSFYDLFYDGLRGLSQNDIDQIAQKTNTVEELGLALQWDWQTNAHWKLGGGYQFFTNQVTYGLQNNDFMENGNDRNPAHTVFGYATYEKGNVLLKGSLRASYYQELSTTRLEPRVYTEYKINEHWRAKGSAEIRNQSASQIIEFATQDFGLVSQLWVVADQENFPILNSRQFTAGLLWQKAGWNLDMEGYHKNIDGLTSISNGFLSAENSFTNGESSTWGLDILLKRKWNNYSSFLAYTLSDTNFLFDDLNNGQPFAGNNDITHSLTWSHSYTYKALQLSLGWNIRTGIPFTDARLETIDGEPEIVLQNVNATRLPSFHRLDVSALYGFQLTAGKNPLRAKVGLSLLNVYGRQNTLSREFGFTDILDDFGNLQTALREVDQNSLQFTPNLIFRIIF